MVVAFKKTNIHLRNDAVTKHAKLVHKIVHRMIRKCTEPYEDLYQVGCMGLIKAVNRFDESLGNAFSSFAVPYIEGEIRHYLRDQAPGLKIPRDALEKHGHVKRLRKHFSNLNRQIHESEIAAKIGLSEGQWQFIEQVNSGNLSISWDELAYEPKIDGEDNEADNSAVYEGVYEGLSRLTSRHRYVITQRYFVGRDIPEIAKNLKISITTVEANISEAIYLLNLYISNHANLH
jgi:RNA polymerase sigma-B factor